MNEDGTPVKHAVALTVTFLDPGYGKTTLDYMIRDMFSRQGFTVIQNNAEQLPLTVVEAGVRSVPENSDVITVQTLDLS